MNVLQRIDAAVAALADQWQGRRVPKAVYLRPDDWAEFQQLHDGTTAEFPFGNNPPRMVTDAVHAGLPVRPSKGQASRLYDHTHSGRALP